LWKGRGISVEKGTFPQNAKFKIKNAKLRNINSSMKNQGIYNRLRKIEGQIRGIEDMLANDRSDTDIMIQLEAVKSSISSAYSSFIEELIQVVEGEEIKINNQVLRAILRSVKKS